MIEPLGHDTAHKDPLSPPHKYKELGFLGVLVLSGRRDIKRSSPKPFLPGPKKGLWILLRSGQGHGVSSRPALARLGFRIFSCEFVSGPCPSDYSILHH
jgi:hypothetical protein